jgi:hypothetical protein
VTAFRVFLFLLLATLACYTTVVIVNHGIGFLDVFLGDIAAMGWPGQFNVDFSFMLMLAALWIAWRHRYSGAGIAFAMLTFFGGALFLAVYLLVLTTRTRGDMRALLLGESRSPSGSRSP